MFAPPPSINPWKPNCTICAALAAQIAFEIVQAYSDKISGAKSKRPGLDQLLYDARRHNFDIVLVWAFDRIARSVRHFLEVLDEPDGPQIGRAPLEVSRAVRLIDRQRGMSLKDVAKTYGISKASVCRVIKDAQNPVSSGCVPAASAGADSKELRPPETAARFKTLGFDTASATQTSHQLRSVNALGDVWFHSITIYHRGFSR